jgi:hypothetical protein
MQLRFYNKTTTIQDPVNVRNTQLLTLIMLELKTLRVKQSNQPAEILRQLTRQFANDDGRSARAAVAAESACNDDDDDSDDDDDDADAGNGNGGSSGGGGGGGECDDGVSVLGRCCGVLVTSFVFSFVLLLRWCGALLL